MPIHDHDDPYDPVDAAMRAIDRAKKHRGRVLSGPDGGYDPQPGLGKGMLRKIVLVAVIVAIAAVAYATLKSRDDAQPPPINPVLSAPPIAPVQPMYAQRDVRAYRAPSGDSMVVRKMERGESVLLGRPESGRWAKVYERDRDLIGYVYVTDNFAPTPPPSGGPTTADSITRP